MVRIIIKGGVWQNTEDEVLKAAIAKYGKNQWARISSLLVRKTPKQCKARWYEWLDPSIKKTEWSKTEDEKLLHLAKLMPTQWRTIAPIVGRTATQCLERYQKLLDEAEAKDNEELGLAGVGEEAEPSADDVRKLRPGEIDPDPETKPARPDPIDMDEDEKEMLSEARARLANTQGKKAKRKARERQLEEARRLAVLQKKRELKAAGIIMRLKSKKKGMDYNADIPFEKKPAAGFYDTSEEAAKTYSAPVGQSLRRLENKRKPEEEEAERKKRQRKAGDKAGGNAQHQTSFVAARDAQIQKLKEAEQIGKRRKLVLPSAQVGEAELEQIVKIGQAGESARALVSGEGDGNEASEKLLGEYEGLSQARMARTPRTAPQQDTILAEARNLRNMVHAQTPLLGDENTPLHGLDAGAGFDGATPRHQVAFTPNPLATPRIGGMDPSATPRSDAGTSSGQTPLRTPMRDSLNINVGGDDASTYGETPRDQRLRTGALKRSLKLGFSSLPAPKNDFEVMMPEDDEDMTEEEADMLREEDAAERDARILRRREEEERKALARRSLAVQKGLPRPANVDTERLLSQLSTILDDGENAEAQRLVDSEMVLLMQHDAIAHPVIGTSIPGGTRSSYVQPEDEYMAYARAAVHNELSSALGFPGANEDQIKKAVIMLSAEEDNEAQNMGWAQERKKMAYDAKSKAWVRRNDLSVDQRIQGFAALLDGERDQFAKEGARAGKAEKKLAVTLGGYQARSGILSKRIADGFDELRKTRMELEGFQRLSMQENATGPRRLEGLQEEVDKLERRERLLQGRYQELDEARRDALARIAALDEKLISDAEAANEAAMAQMEDGAASEDVEMTE